MSDIKGMGGKKIHWYPGHMASATRELKNAWRHIDVVVEVADARVPVASRNPIFLSFTPQKPHILLFTHADLADIDQGSRWLRYLYETGVFSLMVDARQPADIRLIRRQLLKIHAPILEKAKKQGRIARPLRILVSGIPNTGKSTLINQFVGKRSAAVEARPGVTRQQNWLRSGAELHFLDTPGILPLKMADEEGAKALAASGAIRDSILPVEDVALWLFKTLSALYPDALHARYGAVADDDHLLSVFSDTALRMGCRLPGEEADLSRFSAMLLDDFRSGRIGKITLEWAPVTDIEIQ